MRQKSIFKIFCFLLLLQNTLASREHPLSELKQIADGLNIEGGRIYKEYLKEGQIWANLCVVLDRPFETGIEWQEITDRNPFPLKEAFMLGYNEAKANLAYLLVMNYYLEHAHTILDMPKDKVAKIVIQVYRGTSGPRHVELLEKLIVKERIPLEKSSSKYELSCYFFPKENVEVAFCYGAFFDSLSNLDRYSKSDILLSFSLISGFHPDWPSSTLCIPERYIGSSLKELVFHEEEIYSIHNHLWDVLPDVLAEQNEALLERINTHFLSFNPEKREQVAKPLTLADFEEGLIAEVDGLFNPSKLPPTFLFHEQNK